MLIAQVIMTSRHGRVFHIIGSFWGSILSPGASPHQRSTIVRLLDLFGLNLKRLLSRRPVGDICRLCPVACRWKINTCLWSMFDISQITRIKRAVSVTSAHNTSQSNQTIHNLVLYIKAYIPLWNPNRHPNLTIMTELQWHSLSVPWNNWLFYDCTVLYIYIKKSDQAKQFLPSRCGVICNRKHNCDVYTNCATCLSGISIENNLRVCSTCKAGFALGAGNCKEGQCYMFSCQ